MTDDFTFPEEDERDTRPLMYLNTDPPTAQAALYAALARAQGKFPPIPRSREVTVRTKTGGSYKFSYAPLDVIFDALRQALSEEGLAVSQPLFSDNGKTYLDTLLMHKDGGAISSRVELPPSNGPQEFGSGQTYMRRYSLQSLLGIATEEDDDGNVASGNTVAKQKDKPVTKAVDEEPPVDPDSPEARKQRVKEFWYAIKNTKDVLAQVAKQDSPERLKMLMEVERERPQGARRRVVAAINERMVELGGSEGEPAADPDVPVPAAELTLSASGESPSVLSKVEGALGYIAENPNLVGEASVWTRTNVLVGIGNMGQGVFGTLAEVPEELLDAVWRVVPAEVQKAVEQLGPEALAAVAAKAK